MSKNFISQLPNGWTETNIGEVVIPYLTENPKAFPSKEFTYIDISSIDNTSHTIKSPKSFLGKDAPSRARRVVKSGDILFSTVRTYLKNISRVPDELDGVLTSTGIAVLRPVVGLDASFLFYIVLSDRFIRSISSKMDGTLYPAVTDKDVTSAHIPLPPLNEQRRIVTKIEELTAHSKRAREALEDVPKLIDQFRQSVLAAAFRGDLTAEWRKQNPDVEPASELLERIRDEHLEEYQAAIKKAEQDGLNKPKKPSILSCNEQENPYSCLSNLPSGWIFIRLDLALPPGCIFDGPFGSHLKTSDYVDSGVRVIRLENISSLNFIDEKKSFITLQKYEFLKKHSVYTGDLIFSSFVADGVRVCILPVLEEPAIAKADCFCLRPDLKLIDKEYLAFLLSSPQFFVQLQKLAHGATRLRVNTKQLRNAFIPLCSLREQRKIVQIVQRTFLVIDKLAKGYGDDVSKLNQLDQSILAKAFRGELVPQDPDDEPASVLLERIRGEREKLNSTSKGKRSRRQESASQLTLEKLDT